MTDRQIINIYCDESCHLEGDGQKSMAWGGVYCSDSDVKSISEAIKNLKKSYNLPPSFEAKWTKISPAKVEFYLSLIDLFLSDDRLRFRGLVVPDKAALNHGKFSQTHDEWYYKMYYFMLRPIFCAPHKYRIYLDLKDTKGGPKTRNLHEVVSNSLYDFNKETIERIQQIRSHESELMQITDLLIGAVTYENRGLQTSNAKLQVVTKIKEALGPNVLSKTSPFSATKFNLFAWKPQEGAA